ncbi:hypothetical protein HOD19_04550 [bacterium]|jgi:hypothetical protein|nr:hypothetical protein [bacterium]MBT4649014.1 hypothetical protein [bacterium]
MRSILSFLSIISILVLTGMVVGVVSFAADTAAVTATVTARNISVTVSDGSIAYGNVGVGGTASTTSSGVDNSQTATNNGNVSETFNIIGSDSTAWTLESSTGANQYTQAFCNTLTCDSSPTWTLMQEVAYTTLSSTTVATSTGTQIFDTRINLPSSSTSYTEQSVDMTVQAVISY